MQEIPGEIVMGKGKRVAFYLRVSTGGQTVENQRQELARAAEQRGWTVVELYSDNGFSGAKGRDKRPAFDRMCRDASAGKFDIIAAWSVDRLGRSVLHLAQFVEEMRGAGVGLFLLKQALDSETSTGRAMLGMCSVFAELEREIIRERIFAGLARARAQGKTLGRLPVSNRTEVQIRKLRNQGMGKLKIARTLRCGVSTVQRVLATA
ncbi:MAG TPA: recombinase family protein [Solirubrobacteraceae bacterium]|nr:recombinase family protein [Solirubrobacteraceae bacterium]